MIYLSGLNREEICSYHQFQGDTNDCGPFAVAMAVSMLRQTPRYADGKSVARWMNRYPLLARVPGWATFPWGMAWFVRRKFGIPAKLSIFAKEESLQENVERGRITIVVMGWRPRRWTLQAHFALLYGYDAKAVTLLDSANLHCLTTMGMEEFLRKWRFLGRIMVTIGR